LPGITVVSVLVAVIIGGIEALKLMVQGLGACGEFWGGITLPRSLGEALARKRQTTARLRKKATVSRLVSTILWV
jgi:hypothetical protein